MSFMNREALKKEASKKKFTPAHNYAKHEALESKKTEKKEKKGGDYDITRGYDKSYRAAHPGKKFK